MFGSWLVSLYPVWGMAQQRRPLGWGIRIRSGSAMVNTSRGDPHTHPIKVMKLTYLIAISLTAFVIAESALAQSCANHISVGGKTACVRTMSSEEIRKSYRYHRGKKLERMERAAERDVERGYDPSVSLSEFRRRLNKRSDIQDAQRKHRYSN